jgi:hypothetical protein
MNRDEAIKAVESYDGKDFLAVVATGSGFVLETISHETPAADVAELIKDKRYFLVAAPDFDPAAFDRLDWTKIKALLEAADAEPVDDDPDQVQRTVYLGSVLNLTPSGKVYTPFANGNVRRCPFCHGTGNVDNPFVDDALLESARAERSAIIDKCREFGLFQDWPADQQDRSKALDAISEWARPILGCPHCCSMGSREAHEDDVYREYIEDKADELGAFITGSEGDGCDILIAKVEPAPEKEDDEDTDDG